VDVNGNGGFSLVAIALIGVVSSGMGHEKDEVVNGDETAMTVRLSSLLVFDEDV